MWKCMSAPCISIRSVVVWNICNVCVVKKCLILYILLLPNNIHFINLMRPRPLCRPTCHPSWLMCLLTEKHHFMSIYKSMWKLCPRIVFRCIMSWFKIYVMCVCNDTCSLVYILLFLKNIHFINLIGAPPTLTTNLPYAVIRVFSWKTLSISIYRSILEACSTRWPTEMYDGP